MDETFLDLAGMPAPVPKNSNSTFLSSYTTLVTYKNTGSNSKCESRPAFGFSADWSFKKVFSPFCKKEAEMFAFIEF
ncbi:hypothetical protein BAT02nite_07830 [Bacillus atrophaeus]|nr:hypothetical protein BAT02nite_07830 [Bacillus atrophaeus]